MKYTTDEEIKLGDIVGVGRDDTGVVVGVIDAREFLEGYLAEDWVYLSSGVLILTQAAGLIHYPEPDCELQLIARKV
ncbi:hypothetical protein [Atopomonas hussainii]|uniref:hypothetical protein n=1 Tax=Atopomonas hussainii TaxID=1429083 RepID=UPI0009002C08|nr:hypothetical protein [Atopomonas hussainii]